MNASFPTGEKLYLSAGCQFPQIYDGEFSCNPSCGGIGPGLPRAYADSGAFSHHPAIFITRVESFVPINRGCVSADLCGLSGGRLSVAFCHAGNPIRSDEVDQPKSTQRL